MSTSPNPRFAERLTRLRAAMRDAGVAAVILPSADPHQSEYVTARFKARAYFSGFTGSAGTAVVTLDGGGVWTDSRYFASAPKELARTSALPMERSLQGGAEYVDWLVDRLGDGAAVGDGATVGIDGALFTVAQVRALRRRLSGTGIALRTDVDLPDAAWPDRPALPSTPMFSHDVAYAGRSAEEKLGALRQNLREAGLTHTFLTALDEIAWLLNVRASDIESNPLALAYLLVGLGDATLFTDGERIDAPTRERLEGLGVDVRAYGAYAKTLRTLPAEVVVGVDEKQVNAYAAGLIAEPQRRAFASPLRLAKAVKNATEIEHLRNAHAKDGRALVRAFLRLDELLDGGGEVRECDLVGVLHEERSREAHFYGDSFAAIVGYGENGALPHYHSVRGEDAVIRRAGVLLVDSGGQYADGTTDVTRTFGLGAVSEEARRNYTLVLKGMIALSRAVFPVGTRGVQLDALARQHLWQHGLNFGHGTGHGVGFFLNVHEPPQGFVPGLNERGTTGFRAGMLTSNEPGYYEEGAYGIRIENLVLATEAFPGEEERAGYLRFETVTYFPIDRALLTEELLTPGEAAWLEEYHRLVWDRLSPGLGERERAWLRERCF